MCCNTESIVRIVAVESYSGVVTQEQHEGFRKTKWMYRDEGWRFKGKKRMFAVYKQKKIFRDEETLRVRARD